MHSPSLCNSIGLDSPFGVAMLKKPAVSQMYALIVPAQVRPMHKMLTKCSNIRANFDSVMLKRLCTHRG